jgi:hypothetical protein
MWVSSGGALDERSQADEQCLQGWPSLAVWWNGSIALAPPPEHWQVVIRPSGRGSQVAKTRFLGNIIQHPSPCLLIVNIEAASTHPTQGVKHGDIVPTKVLGERFDHKRIEAGCGSYFIGGQWLSIPVTSKEPRHNGRHKFKHFGGCHAAIFLRSPLDQTAISGTFELTRALTIGGHTEFPHMRT